MNKAAISYFKKKYRNNLLAVMLNAGIKNQRHLAKMTGIREETISRHINNKSTLSLSHAVLYRDTLNRYLKEQRFSLDDFLAVKKELKENEEAFFGKE